MSATTNRTEAQAALHPDGLSDLAPAADRTAADAWAETLDALFRAHYRRVCRIVYRIVGQTDLAEALAADAFWKLHQHRPTRLTNAEAWLCRTAVRLALDTLRKDRRRQRYESAAPPPPDASPPDEELARSRERRRVHDVLASMKPAQATLLLLRAEGLTYAEVAAALGLNPASVGTMVSRAEARFKQEYEARHGQH